MGARLIFHCLEILAAEGGVEARGIVENAVLIGEILCDVGLNIVCAEVLGLLTHRLLLPTVSVLNSFSLLTTTASTGAPIGMDLSKWAAARAVVAGRLVNCYAWNDWILALLYRSKSYEIGVAGLYPIVLSGSGATSAVRGGNSVVTGVQSGAVVDGSSVEMTSTATTTTSTTTSDRKPRVLHKHGSAFEVENFDVSHLITSHTDYPRVLPAIIAMLDL